MNIKRVLPVALGVLGVLGAIAAFAAPASADVVGPCKSYAATGYGGPSNSAISLLPINGGGQTYCQSAYGWSDSWFPTSQPSTYNQSLDAFSGDNAPGASYSYIDATGATQHVGSSNSYNLISPWIDGGNLDAIYLHGGTSWSVTNNITVNGNVATSQLSLNRLSLLITTTVFAGGMTEAFQFTNNNSYDIADLLFSDYFNFHPDGSVSGSNTCGTTSVSGGTVKTVAGTTGGCTPIVKSGSMSGSKDPIAWDLGLPADVADAVANETYNDATGPLTGDIAAYFLWDLGGLGKGQTTNFTITKRFDVPEPGSFALLAGGLLMLGLVRRRRQIARI